MPSLLFDESFYLEINEARWAMARRVLEDLRTRLDVPLESCLDVGCGPGWFSDKLVSMGFRVEGVEGRPALVEEAARRVPAARFHRANVESEGQMRRLPEFDLVFCFGLLYHTENPFRVIRNLHHLTRRVLFIETQLVPGNEPHLRLVSEGQNNTQGLTFHSLIPTRSALIKMLHCAGFAHVGEYVGTVDHEDFVESERRHRRRFVFLASKVPLDVPFFVAVPDVAAPKYDYRKHVRV